MAVFDAHCLTSLQLLLFESERAWAHAQELSAADESRRSTARYRRSHNFLSRLLTLARSPELPLPLSPQATVELIIYALIHTARFNLRRPAASTAAYYSLEHDSGANESETQGDTPAYPLVQLAVAYALLDQLEKTARTSKEVALARAFKDDIGPEIRWCIHEFNRGTPAEDECEIELAKHVLAWKKREWDVEGIVGDVAPAYAERVVKGFGTFVHGLKNEAAGGDGPTVRKQILEDIIWDGEPVPVRNPELVDVLLKVQDATRKLEVGASTEEAGVETKGGKGRTARWRIAKYDGVLQSLSDAVDQARKLADAQQVCMILS
jgi:signal recognition particle subunit SRP68